MVLTALHYSLHLWKFHPHPSPVTDGITRECRVTTFCLYQRVCIYALKITVLPTSFMGQDRSFWYSDSLLAGRSRDHIPTQPWGPPIILFNECHVIFGGSSNWGMELTNHSHLAPSLKKEYSYASATASWQVIGWVLPLIYYFFQ